MIEETLSSETCAECGRVTLIEDAAPPIQAGPTPIVPIPPVPAEHETCEICGKLLVAGQSAGL